MMTNRLTPAEAWQGFVGSQTPQEFMELSRQKGHHDIEDAVTAYAMELPNLFDDWDRGIHAEDIIPLLVAYIREQGIS